MNITFFLLDVLKFTLAGLIVLLAGFYVSAPYRAAAKKRELLRLQEWYRPHTIPLRLQAYERIIVFVERIKPENMLLRLHAANLSASEMHHLILSEIRNEFQHNISQQLYISRHAWKLVRQITDDTIMLINDAARSLPDNASALDLNKAILIHLSGLEDSPYENALALIKEDIQKLF